MINPSKSEKPAATGLNAAHQSNTSEDTKHHSNLIDCLGKRGHSVYELGNAAFVVTRWRKRRHCPDLAALVAFGRCLGVTK